MEDWGMAGAAELGRGIETGEIDPVGLTEGFLEAIAAHPAAEAIYARTTPGRARAEARAAQDRARAGMRRSTLDGVPVSWKDLYDTAGVGTEAGSALLRGRVPAHDARVVANATAAGLVCLGKTHTTELAFSGLGLNPVTGTPPNVHDPARLAGGSSSGAAASVAHGLAAAGLGTDTAGSVRIPAAWNDLVGLKTTHGSLPLEGVVPLCPSFDTAGPLARDVADAALVHAAIGGTRPPDLAGGTLRHRRILVLEGLPFDAIEDAPRSGFETAIDCLETAGAAIERQTIELDEAVRLMPLLFAPEAYGVWGQRIEADPDLVFAPIRERFRGGRDYAAHDFVAGWQALVRLRRSYLVATAGFDAVALPACAIGPPVRAEVESDPALFAERNLMSLRNTRLASLLGLCAITLPTGTPSAGLMLQAPGGHDLRLLRLAAAAEAALR